MMAVSRPQDGAASGFALATATFDAEHHFVAATVRSADGVTTEPTFMLNTARSARGMVVSPHHLASQAGLDVLKDGGDAVEATVAVAACLAVVYPHMTGIGGDSFWLVAEAGGTVHAIDACGRAAGAADLELYKGFAAIPARGGLAANTVAGAVSGWLAVLGSPPRRLPLDRLLQDAIHYAETGVPLTGDGADVASDKGPELRGLPGGYRSIFEPDDRPLVEGERLRQPQLAQTLRRLSRDGLASFYSGDLATDIAYDLQEVGSPVTASDLKRHRADRPSPLKLSLPGLELFNMPPPTQGLASLLILGVFERLKAAEADSFDHVHGLVEATKQAFLIRDEHVGDPAWMSLDAQGLLNDSSALDAMAAAIDPAMAMPWPRTPSSGDTTWFGAVDQDGTVVSAIQSLYFEFGSGVVLPRTGIAWQNRGATFCLTHGGWNALEPYRKPFHTLNPALAKFNDGRIMAYGTMGGEGQPQTQAAVFTRYARFGVALQKAITAPRWVLGRTWGEETVSLRIEDRFDSSLYAALRKAGHDVEVIEPFSSKMGHAGALVRHPGGLLEGASDPRSDGSVAAW